LALNLLRAVSALEQNHPDETILYVKRYPEEPSALYYQAVAYIKKKEISSALPLYQQILVKNPHSEWVDRMRMVLGEAFYIAHDIPLAQEFFKPVTRRRPIRCCGRSRFIVEAASSSNKKTLTNRTRFLRLF